jgi:hypothetical protein
MNFDPLQLPSENSGLLGLQLPKWELIWEYGGSFPHTSHPFGRMKCDSQASLLAHTFASPCLGHEPKIRVTTMCILYYNSLVIIVWSSFARIKSTSTKLLFIFDFKLELVYLFFFV